jgi:hypothetical protein
LGRPTTHLLLLKRRHRARDREEAGIERVRVVDVGEDRGFDEDRDDDNDDG